MVLVETPLFTRQITSLLSDDEYQQFQEWLSDHPDLGSRIPGASGLRKIRLALQGRGKRGGARVIYLWQVRQDKILCFMPIERTMSKIFPQPFWPS